MKHVKPTSKMAPPLRAEVCPYCRCLQFKSKFMDPVAAEQKCAQKNPA